MGEPRQRLLGDRYELRDLLATGGMGQVWRARDTLLQRFVAVKVLRPEFSGDPTFLARFRAEAQHTAVLAHRNIATLHDYGEAPAGAAGPEPLAYLVMELVEGDALSGLLVRQSRLSVERTLDLLRQTADALAAAHRAGVVHRDVKPGNVLVGDDGVVKITDFGIAWSASSVPLTLDGQVVGTAHYLSPEQAAGGKATPASDVYALGLIGYECLAGRRAFDGENAVGIAMRHLRDVPDPLPDDVPPNVRTLIERALVKDPAQRYPDGAAFRDAVDDVLAGRRLPPAPRDGGTRPLAVPDPRRRRLVAPLVALFTGIGIAVAGVQLLGDPRTVPAASDEGTATPSTVVLAAADYVGRPVDDVEAALGALGLAVERVPVETGEHAPGVVTAISPAGAVAPGALVAVSYAVAPPPVPAPAPVVVSPPPAQQVADAPAQAAPPAAGSSEQARDGRGGAGDDGKAKGQAKDKAKDKGKGNGKAKGKAKGSGR